MSALLNFIKSHATSVSSWAAVLLTVIGTLLASGIIGPGTALYQVLGGIVSALTALGVKSLAPAAQVTTPSSTAAAVRG